MTTPRTPQRSRLATPGPDAAYPLESASPSRPPALTRVRKPSASASPQIKAALAALRKTRQASSSPSLNSPNSSTTAPIPDPFSTPPRASTSSDQDEPSNLEESNGGESQEDQGDCEWARKNVNRLIETAKKTGLLNLASQGIDKVSPSIYAALLPRSSPYHPSRRNRSTFREEPTRSYSFNRDENETAWFEQADLKSLNLANNELRVLDEEVGGFEDLEFLDLHGNLLPSIPPSLGYLVHLTSLNLASNSITVFPTQIVNLRFLRDLDLSHNKLEKLWTSAWEEELAVVLQPPETSPSATPESPERIRDFFADSPFRRSQPELTSSSPACPFPLLQSLNLAGNAFNKSTFTSIGFELPPLLKTLNLSECQLVDISLPPLVLGRLRDLSELDLSGNGLTEDVFSPQLFPVESPGRLFPALRILDLSLNLIDNLGPLEEFLTDNVSRPIEYVGLAKVVTNLVKSEEQRLRGGKRIGLRLATEAQSAEGTKDVGFELEVRLRECMLRGEQERRRAKFPSRDGGGGAPSTPLRKSTLSVPPATASTSASPSSSPPRSMSPSLASMGDDSPANTTPSRKQVILEDWEVEAAAGLSTPAGRRKAAAQAARERAERLRREEEEKLRIKEERARQLRIEAEEREAQEARALEEKMEKATLDEEEESSDERPETESTSPPPYSPRDSPSPRPSRKETLSVADPSDPALQLVMSALNASSRAVNLSGRALVSLPALSTGAPPASLAVPSILDLSRNLLTSLPFVSIESWNWTSSLRTMTLTHNRISTLSPPTSNAFPPLPSVTALDLSYNVLTSSPSLFSELETLFPSLRTLSLSHNRLSSLEGIESLLLSPTTQLRSLSLNGNKISDITALCRVAERVGGKKTGENHWTLEQLDLCDNEIARLQPTLGLLPHDLILSVSGNTFRFPRREIWENPGARLLLPNLRERLG